MKFLVCEPIHEAGIEYLRQYGEVTMAPDIKTETLVDLVRDKDAIFVRTWRLPEEVIDAGVNLKVIARQGKEMTNIPVEYATKKGIAVVNAAHSNALSVAEHNIALMMAISRHIVEGDRHMRAGDCSDASKKSLSSICSQLGLRGCELSGKVHGIIGYGDIGKHIADISINGFKMHVLINSRTPRELPVGAEWVNTIDEVFERSDFVSMAVPILPETTKLIGEAQFRLMKPSAYFINISRGKVVVEAALVRALSEKWIRGAALDVFETEPPAADNPLFKLDNVVLTPHAGAITDESLYRMAMEQVTGVVSVLKGVTPPNLYNPGYEKYIPQTGSC